MKRAPHKTIIFACGALAKKTLPVKETLALGVNLFDLKCLLAGYHNFPSKIVPEETCFESKEAAKFLGLAFGHRPVCNHEFAHV